jgi:hypothetical protein
MGQEKPTEPFRFLTHEEFAALSQDERIKYLKQAIDALKAGRPLDDRAPPDEQD